MKASGALIELFEPRAAGQRCPHGIRGMVGIVQRRAEHGDDRVADIFVDEAAMLLDDIRHRREVFVHQRHELGRVIFSENEEKPATSEK